MIPVAAVIAPDELTVNAFAPTANNADGAVVPIPTFPVPPGDNTKWLFAAVVIVCGPVAELNDIPAPAPDNVNPVVPVELIFPFAST